MNGNVCGYVVRDGRGVAEATVTVVDGPGEHVDLAPLTDQDGWFALDGLAAGRWRLVATGGDGSVGWNDVDVFDDSLNEVTIELGDPEPPVRHWVVQEVDVTIEW